MISHRWWEKTQAIRIGMAIVIVLYTVYRKKYEPMMPQIQNELMVRRGNDETDSRFLQHGYKFRGTKETLNKSSAAGRRIFCPIRSVLKTGNTYSIPTFSELSAEPKSSAASSCRFNQSFPNRSWWFCPHDWLRGSGEPHMLLPTDRWQTWVGYFAISQWNTPVLLSGELENDPKGPALHEMED